MITLQTGVNGSGKTLYLVAYLVQLFARWAKYPEEVRPVYVFGVHGLNLPVLQVPYRVETIRARIGEQSYDRLVPLWDDMPEGSLVIFDEAQKPFPTRSAQSAPPEHILWFTEHRRLGFDFVMMTQHPKFLDPTIRALVGRHLHFRRIFGGNRSIIYEWDCCSDSISNYKSAVKTYFPFPKKYYEYYKSAEIHTKQSFKKPLWLLIPVISLVLLLFSVPKLYSIFKYGMHHQEPVAAVASSPIPAAGFFPPIAASAPVSPPGYVSPPAAGYVAPVSQHPVPLPLPSVSACLATATSCKCFTAHAVPVPMPDALCREAADHPTPQFRFDEEQSRPFRQPDSFQPVSQRVPASF